MKQGETVHLGDGAYLHYTGWDFEFLANDHQNPTDRVVVEQRAIPKLIQLLQETHPGPWTVERVANEAR
jgi:hypothetical protein